MYWEFYTSILGWNRKDDLASLIARVLDPYYTEFLAVGRWDTWYLFEGQYWSGKGDGISQEEREASL